MFIELRVQHIKIPSLEHVENMLCTQIVFCFDIKNNLCTHLSNKLGGWNKRGGGAKVANSLNMVVEINVEGGIFWKKTSI